MTLAESLPLGVQTWIPGMDDQEIVRTTDPFIGAEAKPVGVSDHDGWPHAARTKSRYGPPRSGVAEWYAAITSRHEPSRAFRLTSRRRPS